MDSKEIERRRKLARESGSRGGQATKKRYGRKHFVKAGTKGGEATRKKWQGDEAR